MYSYAWTEENGHKPLINAFIPQSGAAGGNLGAQSLDTAKAKWWNISDALSCGGQGADAKESLECVRKASFQDVLKAQANLTAGQPGPMGMLAGGMNFLPVGDDVVAFTDYEARGAAGRFIKKVWLLQCG